ncbi:hypothetical protein IYV58_27705 (plasmid) [Klebsiella sp. BDA134-6]|uniref:hypothetical protein n=1 Tax=Klebsiella sp. BDA134-6 TaxID=2787706 RepID=UPI00189D0DF6|nr:hypothetical protein [Klebsiella sp. BDA134-6]QPF30600.1 hypothetical protein IYV58_27705 [Klebsiella sp. BDA134-6]
MLFQNDVKDCAILGESALRLALVKKEISISSLIAMLEQMAECNENELMLNELSEARNWLKTFLTQDLNSVDEPYLLALIDCN